MKLQGWYPQQKKGISSSTQTQRTAQARAPGMGEKFCSQKKQTVLPPWGPQDCHTREPSLLSFSLLPYHVCDSSHPYFGRNELWALMSPDAVHKPSLPSLPDRPFLGFICLLSTCCSDFAEDTPAPVQHRPRKNPHLCAARHFGQRGCKHMYQRQRYLFLNKNITDFFKKSFITDFLKKVFKSSGLSKANTSHKSHMVTFYAHARGEQISKYF